MQRRQNVLALAMLIAAVDVWPARAAAPLARAIQPSSRSGTSQAVIVGPGPLAHTAQVLPLDGQGRIVGLGQPKVQIEQAFKNLDAALVAAGSTRGQTVKLNVYVAHDEAATAVRQALPTIFTGELKPAVCFVAGKLSHADALVAFDAVATIAGPGPAQPWQQSPKLFARHGALQHVGVLSGPDRVYISGQAEKGQTLRQAARATLESLQKTLTFLELNLSDVVQVKSFLHPIDSAAEVEDEIIQLFGGQSAPPLVFVEWRSSLPIEIELIAGGKQPRPQSPRAEYLTPPGMTASPIFARVARAQSEQAIYISGLYGAGDSGEDQVRSLFATLAPLLAQSGSNLRHLLKATYYVADDEASAALNRIRPEHYDAKRPPSASKAMVSGVGHEAKRITIDMIAVPVEATK